VKVSVIKSNYNPLKIDGIMNSAVQNKYQHQAEMLADRVKKRFRHLRKRFEKQHIEVFRLYDWDIPEIRAVVDWYAGHLVIAEYMRKQSVPEWLPIMGNAVASILEVPMQNIHLKERRIGKMDGKRYEKLNQTNRRLIVQERDLKFYVNLDDYIDTGLFSDHRNTRQIVRESTVGKDFLNLFCYTGSFSCYAAKGGARSTVSVDRSETAIKWAQENMALNGLSNDNNQLIHSHVYEFLEKAKHRSQRFDVTVVDPPSFSTTRNRKEDFNIAFDHPKLLKMIIAVMKKGGTLFFSTNHQDFELFTDELEITDIREITSTTIPEDYINKKKFIHRCWQIKV
jgi:23S rRNA (cytosine1962-C5)-methyltransferase